jgi:hypothetical protein
MTFPTSTQPTISNNEVFPPNIAKALNTFAAEVIADLETLGGESGGLVIQTVNIPIPLATITTKTSGVAFNIGSALPAGAFLLAADINVATPLSGGSMTAVTAELQGGSDAAGSIVASTSVFTGAASCIGTPGSNPYANRGGQQIKMTITGDGTHALSALTAGVLSVDLVYGTVP